MRVTEEMLAEVQTVKTLFSCIYCIREDYLGNLECLGFLMAKEPIYAGQKYVWRFEKWLHPLQNRQ